MINNLDFVKTINDIINYREDQKELIDKAFEISNNDPLNTLQYIVTCLAHEGYDVEMELVFEIPANKEVTITLPIIETEPKDDLGYYVIWNDGQITHNINKHTYKSINNIKEYHVKIFGLGISGYGIEFDDEKNNEYENVEINGYNKYLSKVISFGKLGHTFTSLAYAFSTCINNMTVPNTLPSSITNTSNMFKFCNKFNQPLNDWLVNNVSDMSYMFYNCMNFNQPLNNWQVSNVTNMYHMFWRCINFNQPLNNWDVSNVKNIVGMFVYCSISEENKPIFA